MYLGSSQHTTHNSHTRVGRVTCGMGYIIIITWTTLFWKLMVLMWSFVYFEERGTHTYYQGYGLLIINFCHFDTKILSNQDVKNVSTKIDFLHGLAALHIFTVTQTSDMTFCWAACWSKNFTVCHYFFGVGWGCWWWVGLGLVGWITVISITKRISMTCRLHNTCQMMWSC